MSQRQRPHGIPTGNIIQGQAVDVNQLAMMREMEQNQQLSNIASVAANIYARVCNIDTLTEQADDKRPAFWRSNKEIAQKCWEASLDFHTVIGAHVNAIKNRNRNQDNPQQSNIQNSR